MRITVADTLPAIGGLLISGGKGRREWKGGDEKGQKEGRKRAEREGRRGKGKGEEDEEG